MKNIKRSNILLNLLGLTLVSFITSACMDTGAANKTGRGALNFNLKGTPTPTPTPTATIEVKRPGAPGTSEAVFIKNDYCSCLNSKADSLNDCSSFCSTRPSTTPKLYMNFTVGPDIALNTELQNLNGWCSNEIDDGNTTPKCQLIFESNNGVSVSPIDVQTSNSNNSISVEVQSVPIGPIYQVYLKETTSGAVSKKVQYQRINPVTNTPVQGLMKIAPMTLFTCIYRSGSSGAFNTFENAFKRHFIYVDQNQPPALPAGSVFTVCHDTGLYGANDSVLWPRLEQIPNYFKLWDQTDTRFMDQINETGASTPNQKADVNDIINKKLKDQGITASGDYFAKLEWSSYPGLTSAPRLGYYLVPFIDPNTNRATCPTQVDYNSNSPLFQILKDLVGVDTEGMWLAQKEAECYTDSAGNVAAVPDDLMIIREHQLKKIWFYVKNGQPTEPTESIFNSSTSIHFYWPPDEVFPFTRKSTQKLYTIRYPSQINSNTSSLCGANQSSNSPSNSNGGAPDSNQFAAFLSPDKRFGCIPAILD